MIGHMTYSVVGVQQKTTYKCVESDEEPERTEIEKNYQLSCFISQSESA